MERLFDSELKVMELLWEQGPLSAKEVSLLAAQRVGWNKNTTYTILKKLVDKGCVRRDEPGFVCTALVSREAAQKTETATLVQRLFGGSKKALLSALLADEQLSADDLAELRGLIDQRD